MAANIKNLAVFWCDVPVGDVCSPKIDNLRLYGGWESLQTAYAILFIEALLDSEEEVRVSVGEKHSKLEGIVTFAPDEWIEIHLM